MKKLLLCVFAGIAMAATAFAGLTWEATEGDNPADCKIVWSDEDSGATFTVSLQDVGMYVPPCFKIIDDGWKTVTLAWDANTEDSLVGYKIYQGTESGNYTKTYDVGNVTLHTVTGLSAETAYYFAATAYSAHEESGYSNEVQWQSDIAKIPHSELSITGVSSEETIKENGRAINAIDGQQGTIWHTKWSQAPVPSHPHEIIIDVGKVRSLCGVDVMRRVVGENGTTKRYQIAIAEQENWRVVAEETVENTEDDIITSWPAVEGRIIRFIALEAFNDGPWTSVSEIDVFAKE